MISVILRYLTHISLHIVVLSVYFTMTGIKTVQCEPVCETDASERRSSDSSSNGCLGLGQSQTTLTQQRRHASHLKKTMNDSKILATSKQKPLSPKGARNVFGEPLHQCCTSPMTGFERDGFCHTGSHDRGVHVVCAQMTEAFLSYTRAQGNDLSTPIPAYGFPGLKPGDRWCLCAARWAEAERAGVAPLVDLDATQEKALNFVKLELLKKYALKKP